MRPYFLLRHLKGYSPIHYWLVWVKCGMDTFQTCWDPMFLMIVLLRVRMRRNLPWFLTIGPPNVLSLKKILVSNTEKLFWQNVVGFEYHIGQGSTDAFVMDLVKLTGCRFVYYLMIYFWIFYEFLFSSYQFLQPKIFIFI